MAIQPAEWEYLYKTSTAQQLPWELGGPDVCLVQLIEQKKIPAKATVLDIGCGLGSAAVYLAALGYRVTAIDLSPTAIEKAKQKSQHVGVTVSWLVGDAVTIKLPRQRFDLVYDRGCLQHLPREQWTPYRQQVVKALKPKGRYAVEVSQDQVSLDELRTLFGRTFDVQEVTPVTHLERPTGIPRYHSFALLIRH